jgi:hypothetical protein
MEIRGHPTEGASRFLHNLNSKNKLVNVSNFFHLHDNCKAAISTTDILMMTSETLYPAETV